MAGRTIGDFFQQVDGDPALKAKLGQLPADRDAALVRVVQVAADAGYRFERDDLERAIAGHASTGELSMQDLDRVVGGVAVASSSAFSQLVGAYGPAKVGGISPCAKPGGAVGPCFRTRSGINPCS